MDHITKKLGQAGAFVGGVLQVQPTTTKVRSEKITHITQKLDKAGMSSMTSMTSLTTTTHHSNTKWIAIGGAIGAVLIIALAVGSFFLYRRFRQRRSYGAVNPIVRVVNDKDVFNAELDESNPLQESSERVQETRLQQRNYESGYDNVDTVYEGTGYDPEPAHGDKRAKYGA